MEHSDFSSAARKTISGSLPQRVVVKSLQKSRYLDNERPQSWDERCAGIDIIATEDGLVMSLLSDAGQSPPKPGWILILTSGDSHGGFRWTLYGLQCGTEVNCGYKKISKEY